MSQYAQDGLADRLKQAFIECRNRYRGEPAYSPSRRWDRDFEKAAELVRELKAEPYEFVRAQFEVLKLDTILMPNRLHGANARIRYESWNPYERRYERAYKHLESQLNLLSKRREAGMDVHACLMEDEAENFDPLFRCVLGKLCDFHDVYEKYLEPAQAFLSEHPIEKEVYRNLISPARLEAISWL